MTDTIAADILSQIMLYFGGPAVIIAIASVISAYNQWKLRRIMTMFLLEVSMKQEEPK